MLSSQKIEKAEWSVYANLPIIQPQDGIKQSKH